MLPAGTGGFFRGGHVYLVLFCEIPAVRSSDTVYRAGIVPYKAMKGEYIMKIVVVKSPKLFAGLLRLMFGIKKQPMAE